MEPRFFDTHCHLDLTLSPDAAASESAALGLGLFDCGVDPRDFSAANERAHRHPGIIAGIGLHPWWLADGRCGPAEVNLLCEVAAQERYIGEVGLDFSARVMRVAIFPSTNACSRLNEDANTHDRFHSIVYCSRPMHRRRQTQKQARSRSSDRSHGPQNASPHSKTVTQSILSQRF